MCGRYSFDDIHDIFEARSIIEDIASRLGNDAAESVKTGDVCPSDIAAVLAQKGADCETGIMSWGFPKGQTKQLIINARSETIFDLNMFRRSISDKKCLIPCTGFYEWKNIEKSKIKYTIRPEGQKFFYLAGLYDDFYAAGERKSRFVILTAAANSQMQDIHHRMPLIVPKEYSDRFLQCKLTPEIIKRVHALSANLDIKQA